MVKKLTKIYYLILLAFTVPTSLYAQIAILDNTNVQKIDKERATIIEGQKIGDVAKEGEITILLDDKKPTPSLMFNSNEINEVENTMNSLRNGETYNPKNLNEKELNIISEEDAQLAARELEEKRKSESKRAFMYLASILHQSKDNWSVWIGDKKITSVTNYEENEIYLDSVKKNMISVIWRISPTKWKVISGKGDFDLPPLNQDNLVELRFKMKTNQTYVLVLNKVLDGKVTTIFNERSRNINETSSPSLEELDSLLENNQNF